MARSSLLLIGILAGVGLLAVSFVALQLRNATPSPATQSKSIVESAVESELPSLSLQSPERGQKTQSVASPAVEPAVFVGAGNCAKCHLKQHESYLRTSHSRSFSLASAQSEPAPNSYTHGPSGRTYGIEHRDDVLVHREIVLDVEGELIAETQADIKYAVGSGVHAKTYLFESDGFLVESPVSWYRANQVGWGMSPGYEGAKHFGFSRTVNSGCVYCHVGQVDLLEGNPSRFAITELSIGCERCHGPGSQHAAKYADRQGASIAETIVHPRHLDRELSEAICQQCHLQGAVSAEPSDKTAWDFRPGEKLTKYRTDFQYQSDGLPMRIVGHVEQMHASKCYQQTSTLTCITCHDPHAPPAPDQRIEVYRNACLSCHQDQDCHMDLTKRVDQAQNDCAHCHMPLAQTNVTHAAFHDHRIAIHDLPRPDLPDKLSDNLIPIIKDNELTEQERIRRKALAMYRLFKRHDRYVHGEDFRARATRALFALQQSAYDDADIAVTLAADAMLFDYDQVAKSMAEAAIKYQPWPGTSHINATRLLGEIALRRREVSASLSHYRRVADYSREATDIYYLGLCEQNAGNTDQAIAALEKSLRIDPTLVSAHEALQVILSSIGRLDEAKKQLKCIAQLNAILQQSNSAASDGPTDPN